MREHSLARFLELPRIDDPAVRRGIFRQTIAALGLAEAGGGPLGLAGADPRALGRSLQVALGDGLLEEMDFIAPAAGAVALYQIAGALPLGAERRAVARKVLAHLYQGNAETFASVAARMALGSTRPLGGAGIRARVALCLRLRGASDVAIDRLALALLTRRELANEWLCTSATGSLPERRMAARLLERAAREVVRRAAGADPHPVRIFRGVYEAPSPGEPPRLGGFESIGASWRMLLADRETLVWRHVAIARGLLSGLVPEQHAETQRLLRDHLTPTEWRRGATSLSAQIAVDREPGLRQALELLDSIMMEHDPGIATALVWGLGPVAESEPEAAEELLEAIASRSPISVAESVAELRAELPGFGNRAAQICAEALRQSMGQHEPDDGLAALGECVLRELDDGGQSRELSFAVRAAVEAFGEQGTPHAFGLARQALGIANERIGELEAMTLTCRAGIGAAASRRRAMELLRDIDSTLLETRVLNDLLLLDRAPGSSSTGVVVLDDLDARLARWLLDPMHRNAAPDECRTQVTLLQRQIRTLLHLLDTSSTDFGDDHDRRIRVRSRWTITCQAFVAHVREHPDSPLTRAYIATVARAFDALVRDSAAEALDVFLYTVTAFVEPAHVAIVAEASMHPDVTQLLSQHLHFVIREFTGTPIERAKGRLEAFKRFLNGFPDQTTLRAEAFRAAAWVLVRALESVLDASSLSYLIPQDNSSVASTPLAAIEEAIAQMHQLVVGAERRCSEGVSQTAMGIRLRPGALAHAVENAVNTESAAGLVEALNATVRTAVSVLPSSVASLVTEILPRLAALQPYRPSAPEVSAPSSRVAPLPAWLPSRRILGGFFVLHQIGGGNVGTVFVVKRAEERHDPTAPRFALKVPEYNATAARTMSEEEFLRLFREEAGALLSIPDHRNIAGFVTFDARAKPKPILVMELVDGVNCERLLASQSMTTPRALEILDGVLAGLEAMHAAGIAHLDVKPSNAIVRDTDDQPVLVDFGLAGRKLRPGCATLCYGAPEIWDGETASKSPAALADVYSFGCFAYELLTGQTLFDGSSELAVISAHLSHDGLPPALKQMIQKRELQPLATALFRCLRQDPKERAPVPTLRRELQQLAEQIRDLSWPIRPW
jgi:hypothetical protein